MIIVVENNGERVKLDLPMDDRELTLCLRKIGKEETQPSCLLADEGPDNELLHGFVGKDVDLDEVNFLSKRLEGLTAYERKIMAAYNEITPAETVGALINLSYSLSGLTIITDFNDMNEVGRRLYLDRYLGMFEEEKTGIDFEAYAKEIFDSHEKILTQYGVYIDHGFKMQQVYDGKNFPLYVHNMDETVVVLELINRYNEKEYLYMPTNLITLEKVKARLGIAKLEECRIRVAANIRLPDCVLLDCMEMPDALILEKFNEMCQEISDLSDIEMEQLKMVLEYVGEYGYSVAANIAGNMDDIEVLMDVTNDEQYGRYLIEESGMINVDEDVLPYIDYAAFGRNYRINRFIEAGYVSMGFVGFVEKVQQYITYTGARREPLEIDERSYQTFYLYSPLLGEMHTDKICYVDGDVLTLYKGLINEQLYECLYPEEIIRGIMHDFKDNDEISDNIISAFPCVVQVGETLMGALECKCKAPLVAGEMLELEYYWEKLLMEKWSMRMEGKSMDTDKGTLIVRLYNDDKGVYPCKKK